MPSSLFSYVPGSFHAMGESSDPKITCPTGMTPTCAPIPTSLPQVPGPAVPPQPSPITSPLACPSEQINPRTGALMGLVKNASLCPQTGGCVKIGDCYYRDLPSLVNPPGTQPAIPPAPIASASQRCPEFITQKVGPGGAIERYLELIGVGEPVRRGCPPGICVAVGDCVYGPANDPYGRLVRSEGSTYGVNPPPSTTPSGGSIPPYRPDWWQLIPGQDYGFFGNSSNPFIDTTANRGYGSFDSEV